MHLCKTTTYHAGGVSEEMLLVTICAGAAFIVLIVGGYFCMKCICEYTSVFGQFMELMDWLVIY